MKSPNDNLEPHEAEILLRVRRSRSGRPEGTIRHPTDPEGKCFSGTLELLAVIEDATACKRPQSDTPPQWGHTATDVRG
jgi:hypothetical protein